MQQKETLSAHMLCDIAIVKNRILISIILIKYSLEAAIRWYSVGVLLLPGLHIVDIGWPVLDKKVTLTEVRHFP